MQVGRQILLLREERKYTRKKLAMGLCSPQALANIEDGISIPDKLLVDVLLQRLGKSPDKLEVIMSAETYRKERIKDLYEQCLEKGKSEKAKCLLEKYISKFSKNDTLQQMYYYRSQAYYSYRIDKMPSIAKGWIKKALELTLYGWNQQAKLEGYLISTVEMENLLAYGKMALEEWKLSEEKVNNELYEIEAFLKKSREYIDKYITDGEEYAKIFPKCARILAECSLLRGNVKEAVDLCICGFRKLQEYGISYYILPLLEIIVQYGENLLSLKEITEFSEYKILLESLLKEYNEDWHFTDSIFRNCCKKSYYLDCELIRGERLAQGITQEKLIEGIYESPESLSRVENGKASPNKNSFEKLMERLHSEEERYGSYVFTESFQTLELHQKINIFINRGRKQEVDELLDRLSEELDLSNGINARMIQYYRIMISLTETNVQEYINYIDNFLKDTYYIIPGKTYRAPTYREACLLNQMCIALVKQKKEEEAIFLYETALSAMKRSKISSKYQYHTYTLLSNNLMGRTLSEDLCQKVIKYELSVGKLNSMYRSLQILSLILLQRKEDVRKCKNLLKQSYIMCKLSLHDADISFIKNFYLKWVGEEIEL